MRLQKILMRNRWILVEVAVVVVESRSKRRALCLLL
jgi:hypothetical protein